MTVTLKNVDEDFFSVLKSLIKIRKKVKLETVDDDLEFEKKLKRSWQQIEKGQVVRTTLEDLQTKTIEDLEAMTK